MFRKMFWASVLCVLIWAYGNAAFGAAAGVPFNAIDLQGRPMVGASVTVVNAETGAPVVVYTDRAATTVYSGIVGAQGVVQFFAAPGKYRVTISKSGLTRVYETDIPDATDAVMIDDFGSNTPGFAVKTDASTLNLIKYNITTSDPTANDDSGDGYSVGSEWINTNSDHVFIVTDVSAGLAVWRDITSGGISGGINLGNGELIFKQVSGVNMQFKSLTAGTGVTLSHNSNEINISASGSNNVHDGVTTGSIPVWQDPFYAPYPFTGTNTSFSFPFYFGIPGSAVSDIASLAIAGDVAPAPPPGFMISSVDSSISTNNVLGDIYFGGLDSSVTPRVGAKIEARAESAWGANTNASPTALRFSVQDATNSDTLNAPLMTMSGTDFTVRVGGTLTVGPPHTTRFISDGIELRTDNANGITFNAPASLGASTQYILPDSDGSSADVLTTDGSGNLSWEPFAVPNHASTHNPGGGDEVDYYGIIQDEGTPITAERTLNFVGAGVTCIDDSGTTKCTITGSGSGTGITELNGLTADPQLFAVGTSGTDFAIVSASDTHTFNLPNASATARGVISTSSQTIAGAKTFNAQSQFVSGFIVNDAGASGTTMVRMEGDTVSNLFVLNATTDVVGIHSNGPDFDSWMACESADTNSCYRAIQSGTGYSMRLDHQGVSGSDLYLSTATADALKIDTASGAGIVAARTSGTDAVKALVDLTRDAADGNPVIKINEGAGSADWLIVNNGGFDVDSFGSDGTIKVKPSLLLAGINPRYSFIGQTDEGMDVNTLGELIFVHGAQANLTMGDTATTSSLPFVGGTGSSAAGFTSTATSTGHAYVGTNSSSGDVFHGTSGTGSAIYGTSSSTGFAGKFERNSSGSSNPVVIVENQNSSNSAEALKVKVAGTSGDAFTVYNGTDKLLDVQKDGDTHTSGFLKVDTITGTGKVVCVKSDGNLGVCSATTIGVSTCTCA